MSQGRITDVAQRQQLDETLAVARFTPVATLGVALVLVPVALRTPSLVEIAGLMAVLLAAGGLALGAAARRVKKNGTVFARRLCVMICATTAGALLASPALLFTRCDPADRTLLQSALLATIALAPLLGPIRWVSLAYATPMVAVAVAVAAIDRTLAGAAFAVAALIAGAAALAVNWHRQRGSLRLQVDHLTLHDRNEKLALLAAGGDAETAWLWQTDAELLLQEVPSALARRLERRSLQFEGKPVSRLFLGPNASCALSPSAAAVIALMERRVGFGVQDVEYRADNGASMWWRMSGIARSDPSGKFAGYCGLSWDVSDLYRARQDLTHAAMHDSLTQLQGRDVFVAMVARECLEAAVDGKLRALVMIDIQGFNDINSSFGYYNGDKLLKAVAERLRTALPRTAALTRLGADHFAAFYAPSDSTKAYAFARNLSAALQPAFEIGDDPVAIRAAIGLAVAPDHATEGDALFRKAAIALQKSKGARDGSVVAFTPDFEEAHLIRQALIDDIKLGLARGEFAMHFQPLLDLSEGTIVAFEALIRWTSPTRGNVSPVDFIPAAEASSLIMTIGRYVLIESCRAAASWPEPVHVAVNISPKHIRSPDFMKDVASALQLSGLAPTRLEIEITEGVFLDHAEEAVANLHALRARGIRIALDDFGTGYSSLNYLTNFLVDKIKIDRSFIAPLLQRIENQTVVEAILSLARKLGIEVTAEGVETADQALALKLRRCDNIQGYLVSRPLPAAAVAGAFASVPSALKRQVPALFESPLAAAVAMRSSKSAA